jgi:hypothetical protein
MPLPLCVTISPSTKWPSIIDALLGEQNKTQKEARVQLWNEVGCYVERILHLPIGPLNEDLEARRDIAVKVLGKIEANDFAHIREWRRRQHLQCDHASWWTWIRTIARRTAIDFARLHSENVARRGDPFDWVKVEPSDPVLLNESLRAGPSIDPFMMTDVLRNSLEFLGASDERTLADHLTNVQANMNDDENETFVVKATSTASFQAVTAEDEA